MDTSAYVKAVAEQTDILADWVDGKDATTPVPTCPKWTLADLVGHVGATQRMDRAPGLGPPMTDGPRAGQPRIPTHASKENRHD